MASVVQGPVRALSRRTPESGQPLTPAPQLARLFQDARFVRDFSGHLHRLPLRSSVHSWEPKDAFDGPPHIDDALIAELRSREPDKKLPSEMWTEVDDLNRALSGGAGKKDRKSVV